MRFQGEIGAPPARQEAAMPARRHRCPGLNRWRVLGLVVLAVVGFSTLAGGQASLSINRLIHVSAGGTPTENCAAVESVVEGITDASEENRYLVKLEPGLCDCTGIRFLMKEWIQLEGAGAATEIRGNTSLVVVDLASSMELRSLKVVQQATGSFSAAVGVFVRAEVVSTRLFDVIAESPVIGFLSAPDSPPSVQVEIDHSRISGGVEALRLFAGKNATITCNFSILDGDLTRNDQTTVCRLCTNPDNTLLDLDCDPPPILE